ncbi:hypothetical protein OS493_017473 [Desmophyllum pertusum]|uniref:receptor protein-tyrosine kinase n=1 Tax=Desmophyllum pertusum TaxID=174260 RepID=A0A9W9ZPH9_9CNID|nr:hypothetical protein OS493_017473 [Desmophyllum pertusum]
MVIGVPFKPSLTDVKEHQCGVFEVFWKPSPFESGGGPVTDFHVQLRNRGDEWRNCTNFLTKESCLFNVLKSRTFYDIRVQAVNQKGSSDWKTVPRSTGVIGPPDPLEILNQQSELTGRNVTVMWRRSPDKNCNITMYSIQYRVIEPTEEEWTEINITDASIASYEMHLKYSKKYTVIVFCLEQSGTQRRKQCMANKNSTSLCLTDVPYQPILQQAVLGECNSINITWSPPKREALGDPVTDYNAQIKRTGPVGNWINCTSFNISKSASCLVTHLEKDTEYDVRVMAKNKIGFDYPGKPVITERKVSGCNITLTWTKPPSDDCPIRFYTVSYRQKEKENGGKEWTVINITDPTAHQREFVLNCTSTYEFQVKAWNELGDGDPSTVRSETTDRVATNDDTEDITVADSSLVSNTLTTVLVIAFFVLALVLLVIGVRTVKDIKVLEQCEIHPIRTEFVEELGEGAFGRVHKATLKDGLNFFKSNQDFVGKTRRQKIVAVKELHENANEEQKREFLDEIELMKQINSSAGDAKDKELYAESRTHITTVDQDGFEDENNTEVLEEIAGPSSAQDVTEEPDLDECAISLVVFSASSQEGDAPTEKTDEECSDDCESFFPADLKSFAWQIARGMSYLSEKGLVHRDLAARNVLVGHGKALKIADFGLMRQVYHEVYEVQKQKKLPVKWMAPESLYKQIFTSKSDVWSYGVVMWEIATVGGTPYPLLGNAELMRRLKTGYRMEKPDLCSDNL